MVSVSILFMALAVPCALYLVTGSVARALVALSGLVVALLGAAVVFATLEWRSLGVWLEHAEARLEVVVSRDEEDRSFVLAACASGASDPTCRDGWRVEAPSAGSASAADLPRVTIPNGLWSVLPSLSEEF